MRLMNSASVKIIPPESCLTRSFTIKLTTSQAENRPDYPGNTMSVSYYSRTPIITAPAPGPMLALSSTFHANVERVNRLETSTHISLGAQSVPAGMGWR